MISLLPIHCLLLYFHLLWCSSNIQHCWTITSSLCTCFSWPSWFSASVPGNLFSLPFWLTYCAHTLRTDLPPARSTLSTLSSVILCQDGNHCETSNSEYKLPSPMVHLKASLSIQMEQMQSNTLNFSPLQKPISISWEPASPCHGINLCLEAQKKTKGVILDSSLFYWSPKPIHKWECLTKPPNNHKLVMLLYL